ncbi:TAXI family TRAP transporter solute-binding subunit [Streptomyces sp. B1866]|uniref:TAXI family TRAP transporter solute-binding subunit n=1 Tax=Streptomyces sp. B1866 TaxID=3075431 RepID=UPI00288EDEC5|nr:TAXI family TRAP transporter solute-binding subunit [Streptomyces sp. B1866]MDT3395368.1 TAXI family TRAP transporter solute-binding subunit [Streptomyces sp. B1866]
MTAPGPTPAPFAAPASFAAPAPGRRAALRLAAALPPLAALAAAQGCADGSGPDGERRLTLASGPAGGPFARFGERLAREVDRRANGLSVRVLHTSASVANLRLLGTGAAHLGLSLGDSAADAAAGRGGFPAPLPVTALARIYLNYTLLVVLAASRVRRVTDLAGRRVAVGAEGSGTAVVAGRVLAEAGLARPVRALRLGLDESAEALRRGEVDAIFWCGTIPTAAISRLAARTPVRLVPLEGFARALRRRYGPPYVAVSVAARTYRLPSEVPTVGVPSYLVARRDLPARVAYTVTRVMFDARDRLPGPEVPGGYLDQRYAIGTGTVPLHPGAVRYYRATYG